MLYSVFFPRDQNRFEGALIFINLLVSIKYRFAIIWSIVRLYNEKGGEEDE